VGADGGVLTRHLSKGLLKGVPNARGANQIRSTQPPRPPSNRSSVRRAAQGDDLPERLGKHNELRLAVTIQIACQTHIEVSGKDGMRRNAVLLGHQV